MANQYSPRRFETFLGTKLSGETRAETAGIERFFPGDRFPRPLEVACDAGRHARRLGVHEFDAHPGTTVEYRAADGRLLVTIRSADGATDEFDRESITPEAPIARARSYFLDWFASRAIRDPDAPPSPDFARFQCVFSRSREC